MDPTLSLKLMILIAPLTPALFFILLVMRDAHKTHHKHG